MYSRIISCEDPTVLVQAYYKFLYGPNGAENSKNSTYLLRVVHGDCED